MYFNIFLWKIYLNIYPFHTGVLGSNFYLLIGIFIKLVDVVLYACISLWLFDERMFLLVILDQTCAGQQLFQTPAVQTQFVVSIFVVFCF